MRRAFALVQRASSLSLPPPSPACARALSSTPAVGARQRRVTVRPAAEPTDFRKLAKEQVDSLDRRGYEEGAEEGHEGQIERLESNREDPDADWYLAAKRGRPAETAAERLDEPELERQLGKIADELEAEAIASAPRAVAGDEEAQPFPHDETKGDFVPRWMRNLSVAERRAAGVRLREDVEMEDLDEEEDEHGAPTGRAPIVRAESYSDEQLLELLERESAKNVVVLDVRGKMETVDTVVICEGLSGRQLYRMAARIRSTFKYCLPSLPTLHGARDRLRDPVTNKLVRAPAGAGADWLVLELGPTTVHFMLPEARKYYDLEGLWGTEGGIEEAIRQAAKEDAAEEAAERRVDMEKRRERRARFEEFARRSSGAIPRSLGGRKRRQGGDYDAYIRGSNFQ
ncbi:hypothetical protein DFJ74DRAFT_772432 [Hyaloraphidium curvatum]|nr:hypothetical protein DFJ74DRAFT_772432 [Hyaloraphidium curvatum]